MALSDETKMYGRDAILVKTSAPYKVYYDIP